MQYGICHLSLIPQRKEQADTSELVNQVLYGEVFKVIEQRKNWSYIRLAHDKYEGWIDNKQFKYIEKDDYDAFAKAQLQPSPDLFSFITNEHQSLQVTSIGSLLNTATLLKHTCDEAEIAQVDKSKITEVAMLLLNTPYLWGGRSPMGIDCSGFTQLVYRICGVHIKRDASQQATEGEVLSFIEEAEPGDLAFFDNKEGAITHVGIILKDNYIIHASGKVRIDRLDQSGIFNAEVQRHTHKLRVIKNIF